MSTAVKSVLANAVLMLASLAVAYFVTAFVLFRFVLPDLSVNLRPHFPDLAEVFAQTSKAGTVPRDYIALLGDSYAEGQGDGLLNARGDRTKVFHSAHVLRRLTGHDVISLGVGGAGSVQAMVRMPARILHGGCFLYPHLELPRRMLVYFYEGNDLEENGYAVNVLAQSAATTRENMVRYIGERYARPPAFRCYTDLAETGFKMAHFLASNAESWETLRKPSAHNRVLVNGMAHPAPALQKPPLELDATAIAASLMLFDVSLEWLRRNFESAAITVVYLPSPAAIYRHAGQMADTYMNWPLNNVRSASIDDIYAASQRICGQIRRLTLARQTRFLDMRPALRAAAAATLIHGPQDWNHFNEEGNRVLGEDLASVLNNSSSTECEVWKSEAR